jgi:hypothetical protein
MRRDPSVTERSGASPDTASTPSPQRERAEASTTEHNARIHRLKNGAPAHVLTTEDRRIHRLKNGAPAHVLTTEDRRKGAARTNAIKRARRAAFEDEKFERAIAALIAVDEARRLRRRARYEREKASRPRTTSPATSYEQPRPATSAARIAELEARLARTKGAVEYAEIERELAALRAAT